MLGIHASAFVSADRKSLMAECIRKVSSGEILTQYEGFCRHKDGRNIEVSVTGSPIKSSDGKVTTIVAIMHDITKRRQAAVLRRFNPRLPRGERHADLSVWNQAW